MHPNDVRLLRVYTREKAGQIFDKIYPCDAEFEVMFEARAGSAIHGIGGKYFIEIVVRDLTNFSVAHKDRLEGYFREKPWVAPVFLHVFPVPAQGEERENHICDVLASLSVGVKDPNVSFAKSPMFIISKAEEDSKSSDEKSIFSQQ